MQHCGAGQGTPQQCDIAQRFLISLTLSLNRQDQERKGPMPNVVSFPVWKKHDFVNQEVDVHITELLQHNPTPRQP